MHSPSFSRRSVLGLYLVFTVGCGATAVQPDTDSGLGPFTEAAVTPDTGLRSDAGAPQDAAPMPGLDAAVTPADVSVVPSDSGPVTECDPANNGLRCGPPGAGCGSGGGGRCSPSFTCNCGGNQRWSCTVTVPPGCDGGVSTSDAQVGPTDASDPLEDGGPAPACTLPGTYRASLEGISLYVTFTTDGRWMGSDSPGGMAAVDGTYSLAGNQVTLTNERNRDGSSCAMTDRGVYRVEFRPGCVELTLALISEDCRGRGETLSMLRFTRQ